MTFTPDGGYDVGLMNTPFLSKRMVSGGILLGLYGVWVACVRLPSGLGAGTWLLSTLWAVGLFTAGGILLAGAVTGGAMLLSWPFRRRGRATAAAVIETACLLPLLTWLLLNEVVYGITSEVLGYDTFSMIWNNPAATFEAAWEMGSKYLLMVGTFAVVAAVVLFKLFKRSFGSLWPREELKVESAVIPPRRFRLAGSMTGGLAVVAGLLAWQFNTKPSEALTAVFRSAPPLRALNLTRALVGIELKGTASVNPDRAQTLISDETYQQTMGTPHAPPPNVILIVLESVPAKALHCYGYPRSDVTPNMDALAAQGVQFEHCWSTASFSSYGLVSIMTSLYMLRAETNDHFADTSFMFMSLPRALKLAGYETAIFSSGNESFDHINHFCRPADFGRYYTHDTSGLEHPDCMRMDDKYAVGEFESWMSQHDRSRPLYCSFYLQSTHFNYEVPEPWSKHYQPTPPLFGNGDTIIKIPPEMLPLLRNQYDNSMRYSDHWVGRIRDALQRAGGLDNSIIAIIGDHGEGFMEHGLARHGLHVWEEMIHVPLIMYVGPMLRQSITSSLPSHVTDTVSGLDVAPTIVGLVGIKPHPSWQGVNVLAEGYSSKDRPVFSILQLTRWQEAACVNKIKYIYDLTDVQPYLFDLNVDPNEQNNLVSSNPALGDAMRNILGGWHAMQLSYYAAQNRPFTHYIGTCQATETELKTVIAAKNSKGSH